MSVLLSILWFAIKLTLGIVFLVQSISFAIAYYEIANSSENEPAPSFFDFLYTFIVEYIVALLNIVIAPLGYVEPDPLREMNVEKKERPILFVHGYFMSRACFILLYFRLRQAGRKALFTINLRPRTSPIEDLAHQLSEKIEEILVLTKADKIDIISHSMGGIVSRYYIEQMNGAKNINKLITIGTPHKGTKTAVFGIGANARELRVNSDFMKGLNSKPLPDKVRYYSLWSNLDNLVIPQQSSILPEPAQNIKFYSTGHLTLLFSSKVFLKVIEILESNEEVR